MNENINSNLSKPPKDPQGGFRWLLYGLAAFCVFMALTFLLRLAAHKMPEDAVLFGVYKSSDIWLGLAIAIILTYSRYLKRNIGGKK